MFGLTDEQKHYMDTFGFLFFPSLLRDRIDDVDREFETLMESHGGDAHAGSERFCMAPCINHSAYLSTLLDDAYISGIASGLLGDEYQYWNSDGNYYVGDTRWHSDTAWPEPLRFYKMAIYLDPMTRDTGALRVIPGSHRHGEGFAEAVHDQLSGCRDLWGDMDGRDVPAVALETVPGDLVVFNHSTKHSAWGGSTRRRMFTIVFTGKHETESDITAFGQIVAQHGYTTLDVFGEKVALLESAPEERLRHLQQLIRFIPKLGQ